MRIGVISDTHLPSLIRSPDDLGPELAGSLTGVDLILHGGDVTAPSVVEWCEQFAPTLIARGNNDLFEHRNMQERHIIESLGVRIGLVHELRPESRPMAELLAEGLPGEHVDVLIAGDTHVERLEFRDDVLFINPGSPTLPHHKSHRLGTMCMLEIEPDEIRAEVIVLGHSEGARNPCMGSTLVLRRQAERWIAS